MEQEQQLLRMEGTIEHLIYENRDTGYVVFEVNAGGELHVVTGVLGEVNVGESVTLYGHFENHPTHGPQFKATSCEATMPQDEAATLAYLSSGALPYIGPATAKKLVETFGADTLEVIANQPEKLTVLRGITSDKAMAISNEFRRMFGVREAVAYLGRFGISPVRAVEVYRHLGPNTVEAIRQNPYLLWFGVREAVAYLGRFGISPVRAVEVYRHLGPNTVEAIRQNPYLLCGEPLRLKFAQVDAIAAEMQLAQDGSLRLWAGILYVLRHNGGNGHTCLPRPQLLATTAKFLKIGEDAIDRELDAAIAEGEVARYICEGREYLYLPDLLRAEQDIAARLWELTRYPATQPRDLDANIRVLERAQGFAYAPEQRKAIETALCSNVMVLTGGPGTGKTTTVNAILALFQNQADRVALCAPTGRAAKRLSELTGQKAQTIHRLLEVDYDPQIHLLRFIHNEKNLLKCDVVVLDEMSMVDAKLFQSLLAALKHGCRIIMVGDADQLPSVKNLLKCDVVVLDEMSMVDAKLFQSLLAALKHGCRIIMVGDADQLPSVGPGNILSEVIRSGVVPTVCLTRIFRQQNQSMIVENAHRIVHGLVPQRGPGNILSEVIRSGVVPTVCLTRIFRQQNQSMIVENAHRIVHGLVPQRGDRNSDFFFLQASCLACQQLVCDLVATRLPKSYGLDPIRDIQVLCPTKIGPVGTAALNQRLQEMLNPPSPDKPQLEMAGQVFRLGDKVMQVRNNYLIPYERDALNQRLQEMLNPPSPDKPQLEMAGQVFRLGDKVMQVRNNYLIPYERDGGEAGVGAFNGDLGVILGVDPGERALLVQMDDRKLVYTAENIPELEIAYAVTVHKSQGSEFAAVVIPVSDLPEKLCYRNLLYTGVTRAKRLCILAGRPDTVARMTENIRQNLRYSCLADLLRNGASL